MGRQLQPLAFTVLVWIGDECQRNVLSSWLNQRVMQLPDVFDARGLAGSFERSGSAAIDCSIRHDGYPWAKRVNQRRAACVIIAVVRDHKHGYGSDLVGG